MSVQLYNDTASIKLVRGSDTYNIDRSCDLRVYGSQLHITSSGGKEYFVVEFSEVTIPVVANIEALRVAVEAWKEDTISATIDTTGLATSAKQDISNAYLLALNSLVPSQYDYISLTYTGANVTTVVYKLGGSGGTTVSTLTLAYDLSDNLTSVTKS
jgi:hypothetical protein